MNYKLVAIDLDGTLLDDEKKITNENKVILNELSNRGVEIVIATGRRYYSAKEFVSQLDINPIVMANNGTIVRHVNDDSLITTRYFDKDDFFNLIKESRERKLHAIAHVDHYSEGYDVLLELEKNDKRYRDYLGDIANRYKVIDDFLKYSDPKALAIVYAGELEKLKDFHKSLIENYKGKYNPYLMYSFKKVGPMLEIIHAKGSKWISLIEYAESKGIQKEEIIAIGDDNNDIEMIENEGLGIGMKNATKEVKKVSNIITSKTNDESGVGYALKEVFKL